VLPTPPFQRAPAAAADLNGLAGTAYPLVHLQRSTAAVDLADVGAAQQARIERFYEEEMDIFGHLCL
jgi:hypothetical protein